MNYLVGDIGNTSVKISILDDKFDIKKSYCIDTKKLYKKNNVNNFFTKLLINNLSQKILFEGLKNTSIVIDIKDDKIVFDDDKHEKAAIVSKKAKPKTGKTDDNGYIVLDQFKPKN